jgi:hypothetical protein
MTIKFAPVLTNYSQLRYPTILGFEESGQPSTTPYVDSRGYATENALQKLGARQPALLHRIPALPKQR